MKKAFTLAEVLITLGIIGIIAALTMPALIQHYRKKAVETKLQKFYSVMNQAVQMSEVDHGDKKEWAVRDCGGIDCIDYFNEHLFKYINTISVKYVDRSDDDTYGMIQADFADGSRLIIKESMDDMFFYPDGRKFDNSEKHGGSTAIRPDCGKSFFMFRFYPSTASSAYIHHLNKGVEAYRVNLPENYTREDLLSGGTAAYRCIESATTRAYCTALIQDDGWKIPDDYPFKF
jgi:prepilin-type N-terminal cleavage/methylation domain-containing protein